MKHDHCSRAKRSSKIHAPPILPGDDENLRGTVGIMPPRRSICAAEPPLIVAHRGLLLHAPENTLANSRACLELRLGFEFDVEKTKDGHLVCIHDGTVDRTTNGTGKEVGINGVLTLRPNRMSTTASFSPRPGRNPKRSKQNQDQHRGRILGHCRTTQHAGTH